MKVGYELELLAPFGHSRFSIAQAFAQKFQLSMRACFHRESELWPGTNDPTNYYCLTKGFELWNQDAWQLRFINDMTIRNSIDPTVKSSNDWYHVLADDIRLIDLISCQCDPNQPADQILEPIARLYKTDIHKILDVYTVKGKNSKLICGSHPLMTDRNRICEIVTSPITENHHSRLREIILLAESLGCFAPREAAFHIHFDGQIFANTDCLLRLLRYCYVWSDVLKSIIPPNPFCTRLGEYTSDIVDYAFDEANRKKSFEQVVAELKNLAPTKYCDFNFTNILIGNPNKFTFEVRLIPMMLDPEALNAASDLYMGFMNFVISTDQKYSRQKLEANSNNISQLLQSL